MIDRKTEFPEIMSKHIKDLLETIEAKYGKDSKEYLSIANQYVFNIKENEDAEEGYQCKHYEAGDTSEIPGNLERLYKNQCCVEVTYNCSSNCRYCLRSNYDSDGPSDEELFKIAKIIGSDKYLNEVLITGGDPFCSFNRLELFTNLLNEFAPNIEYYRIATRTITQSPNIVKSMLPRLERMVERYGKSIEIATQINSAMELSSYEVKSAVSSIKSLGIPIYSQNVFLKGVNDSVPQLVSLYESMRDLGIESHYLFHACPIIHTAHLRPTVDKMVECYDGLVNSGSLSGRSKPTLALMTSIGKIILLPNQEYEVVHNEGTRIRIRSKYKLADRLKYNPSWVLPEHSFVYIGDDGEEYLGVDYLDGSN